MDLLLALAIWAALCAVVVGLMWTAAAGLRRLARSVLRDSRNTPVDEQTTVPDLQALTDARLAAEANRGWLW